MVNTPQITITHSNFDDPKAWLKAPAYEAPISAENVAIVQREIDAIIGTARDGKPQAQLVWNGDRRYWKEYLAEPFGGPKNGLFSRPWILYKTIRDSHYKIVRDVFVPRWIILTRIEPEQFADTWKETSKFFCPERKEWVQIKPETAPIEWFMWFQTIAHHTGICCSQAARHGAECYGKYAHPRYCLDNLRDVRKGIEFQGIQARPFDTPDQIAIRHRERATSGYQEQTLDIYREQQRRAAAETPLAFLGPAAIEAAPNTSLSSLRRQAVEVANRDADRMEAKFKQNRSQSQ